MNRDRMVTVALVVAAIGLAVVVDLVAGSAVPGRMAVFALASTFLLVLVPKQLAAWFLQRPVGTRPGELGDPADDIADDLASERASEREGAT